MAISPKYAVGLDIGTSSVKAVQMRKVGKSFVVEKAGIAEVYPDGDRSAAVDKERELKTQAIIRALEKGNIKAKYAVSALSGESIIVRYIQNMPSMPEEEVKNAVRWAAEEYIPYSIDEVNIDAAIQGQSSAESGEEVDVLLVSAKKDLVDSHVSLISDAGLTPIIVDLVSFAFVNCYEINYEPSPDDVIALVNIGASTTNINIYQGRTSRFSRDIAVAGDNITTALQNKLGIGFSEAEQLKISVGIPAEEPRSEETTSPEASLLETIRGNVDKLTREELEAESTEATAARIIRNSINNVINEIRRSIQFFENQPKGKPVKKLIIGGGTSRMKGLVDYFGNQIGLGVEIINPFNRISASTKDIDNEVLDNKESLAVGIGLALRKVVE